MRGTWRIRRLLRGDEPPPPPPRARGLPRGRRTLLMGWFSYDGWGATAGDLQVRDVVREWLEEAGHEVDVANGPAFPGGVDWTQVHPDDYDHLVFACGPFPREPHLEALLDRFSPARKVGLNLTLIEPVATWQPFDLLWERDSDQRARPDLSFAAPDPPRVPVAGLCLVGPQPEHRGGRHATADDALRRLSRSRDMAVVPVDTELDKPSSEHRTPAQVAAVVSRLDVLLTTRLHGTVFALRHGVPAVVVDPVAGGAKVAAQARLLGWPCTLVDELDDARLEEALAWCLTGEARERARACSDGVQPQLADLRREVVAALAASRRELDALA